MLYKDYIILEKWKVNLFNNKIYYYKIQLNNKKNYCKYPLKLKKSKKIFFKKIINKLNFLVPFFSKKVLKKKIYKNDKNIMKNIFKYFDKRKKYNYCLNKNTLNISSTTNKNTNSKIKDYLSKHIILCDNDPCCSGELSFLNLNKKKYILFNNNSGSYKPTKNNLIDLQKTLYFFNTKIKYLQF